MDSSSFKNALIRIFTDNYDRGKKLSACSKFNHLTSSLNSKLQSLESFSEKLERISYKNLLKSLNSIQEEHIEDLQNYIRDLLIVNRLITILDNPVLDFELLLSKIQEISDEYIVKLIEIEFVDTFCAEELNKADKITVFEEISKCSRLLKHETTQESLKTLIYIGLSDQLDLGESNAVKIAEILQKLRITSKLNYEITEDFVERYFELLDLNNNSNPSRTDFTKLSIDEVYQSVFLLRDFPFTNKHKKIYKLWDSYIQKEVKNIKKYGIEEIKAYSYYVNKVINSPDELLNAEFGNYLIIKDLSSINFVDLKPIYRSEKKYLNVKVYKAIWEDQEVAVKLFYSNNVKNLKKYLNNQTFIMLLMGEDQNFLKLYGSFITSLPDILKEENMQNNDLKHGCLVMEFIPMSLKEFFESRFLNMNDKAYRQELTYYFAKKLIKTMKRLNSKGIKHKDIKPSNILVKCENERFILKIIDFDVSTFQQKQLEVTEEATTQVVGTRKYMSPEVLKLFRSSTSSGRYNANRSDVFSLGLVLLEMAISDKFFGVIESVLIGDLENSKVLDHLQLALKEIIQNNIFDNDLKNLLLQMLEVYPDNRPSFRDLMKFNESILSKSFKTFEDIQDDDYQYFDYEII